MRDRIRNARHDNARDPSHGGSLPGRTVADDFKRYWVPVIRTSAAGRLVTADRSYAPYICSCLQFVPERVLHRITTHSIKKKNNRHSYERQSLKPFLKWAGGKRWLVESLQLKIPEFEGTYIEPFLGGGAVFFHSAPSNAILSDVNPRLIETYQAIKDDWKRVEKMLKAFQAYHSTDFYYEERGRVRRRPHTRASQFLYLNRTCFNGLYRENLNGVFNVPIGTKTKVIMDDDDFSRASQHLSHAQLFCCDFEITIDRAKRGDLVFVDPPYTTAHNKNGFLKYNQSIFSWDDQERLHRAIAKAVTRGARVIVTNADHESIRELYSDFGEPTTVYRASVISGSNSSRGKASEILYVL